MHKRLDGILRGVLIFWALYALVEGFLYLFNIKLVSVKSIWPESAFTYSDLTGKFLGSLFLLISALVFVAQKDLDKYKELIKISGLWAFFYGGLFLYLSFSQDYGKVFAHFPSLYIWIPFYNQYLSGEGIALLAYSGLVYLWWKKHA